MHNCAAASPTRRCQKRSEKSNLLRDLPRHRIRFVCWMVSFNKEERPSRRADEATYHNLNYAVRSDWVYALAGKQMVSAMHTSSRNSLGFALVGCGRAGERHVVQAAKVGRLIGTCDVNAGAAQRLSRDAGAEAFA